MHFYVIKIRSIQKILLGILILFLLISNLFPIKVVADVFLYNTTRKLPIYCVENNLNEVALTFDAAWGSDKTEDILKVLHENEVTATFFLVGFWVDKNEQLVKKIDEMGFEIGSHSNTHPDLTKLNKTQVELELSVSKSKIENITKKQVKVFRPPFGAYNNALIETCLEQNLQAIQWDVDSLDWKGISEDKITSNVLKRVKSGSIILCHNNADYIVKALPGLILGLKSRGYSFKTVSNLILWDNFKIDNTGKQINLY